MSNRFHIAWEFHSWIFSVIFLPDYDTAPP
jgi:hypothetical protein